MGDELILVSFAGLTGLAGLAGLTGLAGSTELTGLIRPIRGAFCMAKTMLNASDARLVSSTPNGRAINI